MTAEWLMLALPFLPLLGATGILMLDRHPDLREALSLAVSVIVAGCALALYPQIRDGAVVSLRFAEPLPGLPLEFTIEPLGMLFALVASLLWPVTTIYAIGYMRSHRERNQTRFYALFAVALGCTFGVAFAGNLLTLFLWYELLTLATFPLVGHAGTDAARRGARTYLGILLGTSIGLFLLAILATYSVAGTLAFRSGGILAGRLDPGWAGVLLALFVFGIGKAAMMPLHRWLPAAMVAPTPVSALLHAVAVVKAGVFSILKVTLYVFGTGYITSSGAADLLLWCAAATILLASLVAMTRDNLKARLAYSTISQLGYVVLGALLATQAGVIGSALQIAMHACAKITLFFAAGAILVATQRTEISTMAGLGRAMPVTFGAFFIGSLSIIGLPPFGGLWSKWYLGMGTLEAGHWPLLGVLLLSSLLNVAYLLAIPVRAFFGSANAGSSGQDIRAAPLTCQAAMIVTAGACVALFFYPDPVYRLALEASGGR
ncbi:MAG: proton-conducting transporter membrane subunit [Pseudomonadota bacterium]